MLVRFVASPIVRSSSSLLLWTFVLPFLCCFTASFSCFLLPHFAPLSLLSFPASSLPRFLASSNLYFLHVFAFSLPRYLGASSVRFFTFASSLLVCAPRRKSQKETKRQSEGKTSLICLSALSPLRLFALPPPRFFRPFFFFFFVASHLHFPAFCFLILPPYLFFLFPLLHFRAFSLP